MGNARAEEAEPGEFLWELQVWGAGVEMDIYYLTKMPVIPILMDAQTFTKSSEIETSSLGYSWSWNLKVCVPVAKEETGIYQGSHTKWTSQVLLKDGNPETRKKSS